MIYGNTMASVYDALNDGIDTAGWADFICKAFEKYSDIPVSKICEIACGTGSMAIEMSKRGYDVTASDISAEMLTEAEFKSRSAGLDIRFVSSDMRSFSLYNKADAILCLLDSMNYLTKPSDFAQTVNSVYQNLAFGGLFIFDINSKKKFETTYGDNAYVIENEGVLCAWQNFYNPKSKICDFYLSIFTENEDGSYERTDEHQRERMYTLRSVRKALSEAGFEMCGVFSDYAFSEADEEKDERLYIVAKKI
ncbi:MAG: class I SAM-dependent methyltransferase [Clostridia bacterium]|nr:class I SAM-dependent methyltransferase [Clostridia bacterium]